MAQRKLGNQIDSLKSAESEATSERGSWVQRSKMADIRASAFSFTEGVRSGWIVRDLAVWCRTSLLAKGYLTLSSPMSGNFVVFEPGCGEITLATSPHDPDRVESVTAPRILEAARARVLSDLTRLVSHPLDDHCIKAAIHRQQVKRQSSPARGSSAEWLPSLREGEPLSSWVMGLFAADYLTNVDVYQRQLQICDVCGALGWTDQPERRTLCDAHNSPSRSADRWPALRRR